MLEYGFENASGLPARKKALMDLCHAIDFSSLPLLYDTITEIYIRSNYGLTLVKILPDIDIHSSLASIRTVLICHESVRLTELASSVYFPNWS